MDNQDELTSQLADYSAAVAAADYDDLKSCKKHQWCGNPIPPGYNEHPGDCNLDGYRENE